MLKTVKILFFKNNLFKSDLKLCKIFILKKSLFSEINNVLHVTPCVYILLYKI